MLKRFKNVRKTLIASVAACMLLAGGTSAFAAVVNETESNNNIPLANIVNVGDTGLGYISDTDLDHWKFTATTTGSQMMAFISGNVTGKRATVLDITNYPNSTNFVYSTPWVTANGVVDSFNTIAGHQYVIIISANGGTPDSYNFVLY